MVLTDIAIKDVEVELKSRRLGDELSLFLDRRPNYGR